MENEFQMPILGHGHTEGTVRREVYRETPGYCIAHCYLPKGETWQFPDMFGLEETDRQEREANQMAVNAVMTMGQNSDTDDKIRIERGLMKYCKSTEEEDLVITVNYHY